MTTVIHDSEGNDYRSDPISRVLADGLDEAVARHLGNPVADRQWLATTASTLAAAVRAELIQGVPARRTIVDSLCRMAAGPPGFLIHPSNKPLTAEQLEDLRRQFEAMGDSTTP